MKPYEPDADLPRLDLSLHDIQAISIIVTSYLQYLHKGMAPSKKRNAEIVLLTGIQRRMLATVPMEGGMVPLTAQEIQVLANAMLGFAKLIRQTKAQLAGRDELLKEIATLREHLLRMLAGKSN